MGIPTVTTADDASRASSALLESTRSWRSGTSDTSAVASDQSIRASSLHSNLMRSQRKRDPMKIYEVIQVLGEGSMGSVAKVKKRAEAVGGSARQEFVRKEQPCCVRFLSFFKFGMVVQKFDSGKHLSERTAASSASTGSAKSDNNSQPTFHHSHSSSMISYGPKKDLYFALKSIHLDRCSSPDYIRELKNEVEILKTLDHPSIAKAIETFEFKERMFIVLELCSGGDLYTRDPYTEDQAANIVRSLLSAVGFLHDHDVVHRDLKFENIMFTDPSPNADIKVIDFGLSQKFAHDEHLKDQVGTVYTMAPELLAGDYNSKVDVWSVGVIAFMLLSSSMPFYGPDRLHVIKKIIKGQFNFSSRRWKYVDTDAKIFVRDLLEMDPNKRPSAYRALKLSWLDRELNDSGEIDMDDLMDSIQANIDAFSGYSKLKKLALMVIAYKSTTSEISVLKKMFLRFDRLKNGVITLPEFKETLSEHYDYTDQELELMYHGIDIDGTGTVHYSEFLAATMESLGSIDEERIAEAFDRIDCDDTGYITVENLRDFLGDDIPTSYLEQIIDECDLVRDKRISYEEFLEMWNGETDSKLAQAKEKVQAKRLAHFGSRQSSVSDDGAVTDSERENRTPSVVSSDGSDLGNGSVFFQKQKREMSIRSMRVSWV